MDIPEYALELLLAYDGRLHYLASGHYLKFEVKAPVEGEVSTGSA